MLWRGAVMGLALLWAGPASATQEYILPTLFDVTDVAADDVLNIRARPSARSEIIGALAANARDIEVVGHDGSGRWAQVNTNERRGWVALRHLAYRTDVWEPGELPETLRCMGTEPFWSLAFRRNAAILSAPARPDSTMTLEAVLDTGVFRSPRRAIVAGDAERSLTAVITPAICSDGMSDRVYGLDATLVIEDAEGPRMLTGCCSIAPR
ncbi:MAG: COG3650 family protein [Pseudomonadota bacterium]